MLQRTTNIAVSDQQDKQLGLATYSNVFLLTVGQSPACIDVKFSSEGSVEKRFGNTTINSIAAATTLASTAGWAAFDFGAGSTTRYLVVAAGTAIYVSSDRGVKWQAVASSRTQNYQSFERSKPFLIATSEAQDPVLYWAGSAATFMLSLATGSAPAAKYAVDFQGFLMLMNSPANKRRITYADNNLITTDPWNNSFDLPSSFDDEITGSTILNKKLYVFTKYKIFRISYVGGNPDFSYQDVKDWGAVPRTIKKVTMPEVGEVIIGLSWDKTIRIFDGAEDEIISAPIEEDNRMTEVSLEQVNGNWLDRCFAEVDTNEQVYKLWVPISNSNFPTHSINYDYRANAFYPYANQTFMAAVMAESGLTNSRILVGVRSSGLVYQMDTTNTDAGVAINEYFDSHFYFTRTPRTAIKSHRIDLYFSVTSFGPLNYQDRVNFSDTFSPPREQIVYMSTQGTIMFRKSIDLPLTQNVYQFRIGSGQRAEPWELNRVDYEVVPLGVGKA